MHFYSWLKKRVNLAKQQSAQFSLYIFNNKETVAEEARMKMEDAQYNI